MTETARIYGGSLYDLAAEENLTGEILGQMEQIRTLLRETEKGLRPGQKSRRI